MPDRWMEERERRWRERNRRHEAYGRGDEQQGRLRGEARSWDDGEPGRDRVFGERDSGAEYNRSTLRQGGAYRSRPPEWDDDRPHWQDRDYQGVSPAMEFGEYGPDRSWRGPRFQSQDYTRGGRFYGDDRRQPIYREEWGAGRPDDGPRGYDYDEERGYGEASRPEGRGRPGDFLSRAGERLSSWFGGAVGEVRRDLAGERGPRRYSADFGREARWEPDRGHRGRGPRDYRRSDERISDEINDRLTDDPWVDASNITVSVSGGEVTLAGTVENREAKHRAERCVEEVSGVTHVQNNLRVDQGSFLTSPGRGYGDSVLEAQMKGEARGNGGTSPSDDSAATRTTTRRT